MCRFIQYIVLYASFCAPYMAQERIDDWWEYAKDLAKAERELQIERWVYISIKYKDEAGRKCRLHLFH